MRIDPLIFGLVVVLLGVIFLAWALRARRQRGLGPGQSVSLDDKLLVSERFKLLGRPDCVVRQGEFLIPEEWKPSARRIYHGHRLQVAVYCLLIEEQFGTRPPHGVVVLAGGVRVEVPFTDELEAEVISVAEKIREHRRSIEREIPVRQPAAKCRACGQRENCTQARA
jgi:CRISPR-associated exonuclease Cas4